MSEAAHREDASFEKRHEKMGGKHNKTDAKNRFRH
jgi:hypothetical protein